MQNYLGAGGSTETDYLIILVQDKGNKGLTYEGSMSMKDRN